jgi:hypothetical protein
MKQSHFQAIPCQLSFSIGSDDKQQKSLGIVESS